MLEKAKARLRIKSAALDDDINQLIAVAEADINRIGIGKIMGGALYEAAVLCYVQAMFGNNPDRDKLLQSYDMYLTKLKGLKRL